MKEHQNDEDNFNKKEQKLLFIFFIYLAISALIIAGLYFLL